MRVTFWGTRGSLPAAGPETVRYGGNTACVAVEADGAPLVVLDAGSGIRRLGAAVADDLTRIDLLLTHLHMDHVQGLGFFSPLFRPGLEVHVWGPPSASMSLRERLTRYLSPPLFPVRLRDLPCELTLHDVPTDRAFMIGSLTIVAALVIHPGPTIGYRISEGQATIAYLPDHEPALGSRPFPGSLRWLSGAALAIDADLLIHDAQYSEAEYVDRVGWGHSTPCQAADFAAAVGALRLAPFHHDPSHEDATLDALLADADDRANVEVISAQEGLELDIAR